MATYDKVITIDTLGAFKDECDTSYASGAHTHSNYQETLVSGSNIKTINNESLLGSGNITIGGSSQSVFYGTCATAAATAAKAVVCEEFTSANLIAGTVIYVDFTNAQTYNGAPTLNVQSTGAKNIKRVGTTNAARYEWVAGEVLQFVYDGSYWCLVDGGLATTTYYGVTKLYTGATSTSAALALTPASLNNFADSMISGVDPYSTSATYAVGDRVRYGYFIYECNTAITTAEAWTAAHWTALDPLQTQIDGKQDALVSGTNIKTINNESILGSGNITISGGSGGVSYTTTEVLLPTSGWSSSSGFANSSITVSAYGVTASSDVIVSPSPTNAAEWAAAGIICTAQGAGTLTFECTSIPSIAVYAKVISFTGGTYSVSGSGGGSND